MLVGYDCGMEVCNMILFYFLCKATAVYICPDFMLSFFFINCIIKYCCLFCWRPAVMASALPVAFCTLFTCLFIFMFGFVRKINSSCDGSALARCPNRRSRLFAITEVTGG